MTYPDHHRKIVTALMEGKFITSSETRLFDTLQEERDFYTSFFETSFGYELVITQDYAHLISSETNENTSRDISIFFSILCFELDKHGKNFLDELSYNTFGMAEIAEYFRDSSWSEVIKANKSLNSEENLQTFFRTLVKRNIAVKESSDEYVFTKAYKLFTEFARELIQREINENQSEKNKDER
ncbi:hypothetical protein OB69_04125 [Roseivirga seohaensis subsp. aquiponti]|uniref:DUF4194 domain-containing protein n=1 Tax=Roseivirga seohaensis subsp. aquiponti TaxID=1566026 RepID=A0A0L8APR8_9BACT|nr:hypothetical protein [Roseivirga seohaensis]KOF04172.1 hypothetical protein OB69_04125 [Roseivirga seohaensis subsp. aquiponti]